jgi:hypothetical protein
MNMRDILIEGQLNAGIAVTAGGEPSLSPALQGYVVHGFELQGRSHLLTRIRSRGGESSELALRLGRSTGVLSPRRPRCALLVPATSAEVVQMPDMSGKPVVYIVEDEEQ